MSAEQHTILVVDDNEDNRDLIARRLRRAGYDVLTAVDGHRALETLASAKVDLVVLDVMMPGLSGIDVLKYLRRDRPPSELPVIMATAKDQSEDVVEALDAGANDYVTKPLDFPVVLARIQAQLRMRSAPAPAEPPRDPHDGDFVELVGAVRPGMVLGGKYRLESELGAGNFGAVYRASHLGFQHPVAVKILQTSVEDSPQALARFQQEGRSAFRLQHPNAVSVIDFAVTPGGLAYLVMELLEGQTLEDELKEKGALGVEHAVRILMPICEVLHEAHALGIIHRDVKPANIFLHRTRHEEVVKVLDFGIAKLVGEAVMGQNLTVDEGILGTPAYMAPERLWGKPYDGRADAYSVGIMFYQMLVGQPPFVSPTNEAMAVAMMHVTSEPEPIADRRPDLPPEVAAAVMDMLRKEQSERPTVADLACRLADVLDLDLPPALRPQPPAPAEEEPGFSFSFSDLLSPDEGPEPQGDSGTGSVKLHPGGRLSESWTRH